MDKHQQKFDWLPAQMPRVAALIKAEKEKLGPAYVNECWKRGVVQGEPGWFFAVEGSLSVGVPDASWNWKEWPELSKLPDAVKPALLLLRPKVEGAHGTH